MVSEPPTPVSIFISSFHPFVSRNILAAGLLEKLIEKRISVVVLVPARKTAYFEEEFGSKGICIESIETSTGWRDRFLQYLSLAALRTQSLSVKRATEMRGSGQWLQYFLANRVGRVLVRWLHAVLTPRSAFRALFERYQPSLVLATDMNNPFDMRLIQDADSSRVAVVGMVRSWDNLTSKGLLRVIPDVLVVQNDTEKQEAVRLHKVPEARIRVVGIAHYDRYVTGARTPRDAFFEKLGIPSEKRLVLFAPAGDRYIADNTVDRAIVEILETELPDDCHLLVRLPPTDTVASLEGFVGKRVTIERPTTRFKAFKNVELAPGDDEHLADTLYWSDLIVAGPSTIAIDAVFFDKPVVLVGFDGTEARLYYQSIRRYYDYDHWKPVLASGGVWLAENEGALHDALSAYLAHPARNAEGRARMVEAEAYRRDGKSTDRLVAVLLDTLSA
jgi:hypothetical protein